MGAGILAFLEALPGILTIMQKVGPEVSQLASNVWAYLLHATGEDLQGLVLSINESLSQLNNAKTDQEKQDAAKQIADIINQM